MRISKQFLETLLKENEILGDNLHKLTEVDGETIEMKYCPHCKEWHPLTDFSKNIKAKDGLQKWCRKCQKEYYDEMHRVVLEPQDIEIVKASKETEIMDETDYYDDVLDLLSKMQQQNEERQREIRRLEEENKVLKDRKIDLASLSEKEIEKVLKFNKVEPRLLFQAIARQDDRYSFYAIDKVTGLTSYIRLDKDVA